MYSYYTDTYFYTATINKWQRLLDNDEHKQIIIDSLKFCVQKERIQLHGFVIMPNHIHLLVTLTDKETQEAFQRDFLKFTSHPKIATEKQKPLQSL
ncbi:MAG: transposase [Chitinophagales bacterium]|nr:transposase [Chitinophagales bacterium]